MLCLDASVCVKWFKEREDFEPEAKMLLDYITDFNFTIVANEWLSLEVVRGLKRAHNHYPELNITDNDIDEAFQCLEDLFQSTAIHKISVGAVKYIAKDLQIRFSLYAADAIHLATSIFKHSRYFITHDEHLTKKNIKDFAQSNGVKIISLPELIPILKDLTPSDSFS